MTKAPNMTIGRAVLISLMQRYLDGFLDTSLTLLEVHKLMYFMQEAGEDLRLKYKKAKYGPYAENLRHVLNLIEGHYISGFGDGGEDPDKILELLPGAIEKSQTVLSEHRMTKNRFDTLSAFIDGFESPFGLELLATVHWIKKHNTPATLDALTQKVHHWHTTKSKFSKYQIKLANDRIERFEHLFM